MSRLPDLKVLIAGDESLLNRAIDKAEAKMARFTASIQTQSDAQAKSFTAMGDSSLYAGKQAEQYATMQELSSRRVKVSMSEMLASHSATMTHIGDSTVAAGRKISSAGTSLLSMVAPLDLVGATAGKMSVDFSQAMEILHTQANYSQKDVEKLSKSVLELAPKVGASPKELAEGLYHIASAGIEASKAMEIVKEAAIGARVGGSDLNETTYALVSVMKSAPKDIKSVADAMGLMNAIVGQGDLHMQDLVAAFSTGIVPSAKAAGLGLKDVGAALDILTQRGMPAEMSATRLRMTIGLMANPSEKAVAALEKVGLSQSTLAMDMQKPNGLLVAVEDLQHHLESAYPISQATVLTHEQQAHALGIYTQQMEQAGVTGKKLTEDTEKYKEALEHGGSAAVQQEQIIGDAFGRSRSSATVLALTENVKALNEQYEKLPSASTSVARLGGAWKDLQKIPAQQLAEDEQEVNAALIQLGTEILPAVLPVAKDLSGTVGHLAEDFEHLSPGTKKVIVDMALAGTAVGVLAKPIGGLITTVGLLGKGLGGIGTGVSKLSSVIAPSLEETVATAGTAGMEAGTLYGTAFAAAAEKGIAEISATQKMSAASNAFTYDVAGYGATKVPGFGPTAGVPGLGANAMSAEEQLAAQQSATWEENAYRYLPSEMFAAANAPGLLSRLRLGGSEALASLPRVAGFTTAGYLASELAGSMIGGKTGSALGAVGKDASLGYGVGEMIGPVGGLLGGSIGTAIGAITHAGSLHEAIFGKSGGVKDEEALRGIAAQLKAVGGNLAALEPAQMAKLNKEAAALAGRKDLSAYAGELREVQKQTGPVAQGIKLVDENWMTMRDSAHTSLEDIKGETHEATEYLVQTLGTGSAKAKAALSENFAKGAEAVELRMHETGEYTHQGLSMITEMLTKALAEYGIKAPKNITISNARVALRAAQEGSDIGFNKKGAPQELRVGAQQKAVGSWIGLPGERGRDDVPIWAARGEAILNHDQQGPVQVGLAVSKMVGLQPYGSLGELFDRVKTKHFMASGGIVPPALGGAGAVGRVANAALSFDAGAASRLLVRLMGSSTDASAPTGGGFSPSQLGTFDGLKVADWIIPELRYARAHGWIGHITSGYRAGPDPEAVGGMSEHALDIYPGGAVDFGGMVSAAAAANRAAFLRAAAGYSGKRLLMPIGFRDDGHMSGTGHAGGGFVSTAYGPPWEGVQGSGVTATGIDLKDAPHRYIIAVDPSVIPLGSQAKVWPNPFGYTGNFEAADTGGAIKGNRIDFYDWEGRAAQDAWGVRDVTVTMAGSQASSASSASEAAALERKLDKLKRERINLPTAPAGKGGASIRAADVQARKRISNEELTIHEKLKSLHGSSTLTLTPGQESHVQGLLNSTAVDRSERALFGSYAQDITGSLETAQARWEATPNDLATPGGVRAATLQAEQAVVSDKDRKKLYEDELQTLQREARGWRKLRDFYRDLARKQHGNAKKSALDKAATYQSKLTTAQNDIKTLGGKITGEETNAIKAQNAVDAIPAEAQEADLSAYQAQNTKVDQEVRAGVLTEQQGKEAKEANARNALAGGYGQLSEEGLLQVKGDLREFAEATTAATNALEAHTQALEESTKALKEFSQASSGIEGVENTTLVKAMADLISGQIAGRDLQGRVLTGGAGAAARY